jgi:hypothetical protein
MDRPTCRTCPYWDREIIDPRSEAGHCRRYPPRLILVEIHPEKGRSLGRITDANAEYLDLTNDEQSPQTYSLDWCGEHPDFPTYLASLTPSAAS